MSTPDYGTFTFFPMLPPELRDKIWGFAARVPRNVEILLLIAPTTTFGHHIIPKIGLQCQTTTTVPAILHACAESRKHGVLFYKTCMESCQDNASEKCGTIFINPDTDTLIIRMHAVYDSQLAITTLSALTEVLEHAIEDGKLEVTAVPWAQGEALCAIYYEQNFRTGTCVICIAPVENQTHMKDRMIREFDEIEFSYASQLQIGEMQSWEEVGQQIQKWGFQRYAPPWRGNRCGTSRMMNNSRLVIERVKD